MPEIQIKSSSLPRRCEICHQTDLFDANSNICSRCASVALPTTTNNVRKPAITNYQNSNKVFTNLLISMSMVSVVVYVLVAFIVNILFSELYHKFGIPTFLISIFSVIVINYLILLYVKDSMIKTIPNTIRYVPTKIENFPNLDIATLNKYTQELIYLGFQPMVDITLEAQGGISTPGFARIFFHPQYYCFAEVAEMFPTNKNLSKPMKAGFITHFENDWSYGSTDRDPDSASYMIRRPKRLGVSYPNRRISEIFQAHLLQVQTISQNLNCPVIPINSLEEYFFLQSVISKEIKPHVEKLNIVKGIFDGLMCEISPKYEWLGDYPRLSRGR